jgi:hypothetical protein
MKDPRTDAELVKALHRIGYRIHKFGDGFTVEYVKTGAQTNLEATETSEALAEACRMHRV